MAVPADTAEDEILLFAVKRSESSIDPRGVVRGPRVPHGAFHGAALYRIRRRPTEDPSDLTHHQGRLAEARSRAPHVGQAESGVPQSSDCAVQLGIVKGQDYDDRRGLIRPPDARLAKIDWNPLRECPSSTRPFRRSPSPTTALFATATRCTTRMSSGCTSFTARRLDGCASRSRRLLPRARLLPSDGSRPP